MNAKIITSVIVSIVVAAVLAGCVSSHAAEPKGPPPPAVSVAQVIARDVTQWDEFSGRIEAVQTVEIRPRVSGYINKVTYQEGQEVKKGQVLFVIDQRPYRAELDEAQAALARAKTQSELAHSEVTRAAVLKQAGAVSQEEYDQRIASDAQSGAEIRGAQAAVEKARLNLEFTEVRSPIDGRAGQALITEGNLVNAANASLLTTVVSLDPVYLYFDGDEQTYLRYAAMARSGERPSSRDARNPVRVGLANEEGFPHEGYMDFVDNQVNPQTGTIRGRAVLDNHDRAFTPGLFARLQLLGSGTSAALLIDDKAVLTDQDRKYVYVVGPDNKALRRDVKLGRTADGLRVVTAGLTASDKVIIRGTQKVFFPGMPVVPELVAMDTGAPVKAPSATPANGGHALADRSAVGTEPQS